MASPTRVDSCMAAAYSASTSPPDPGGVLTGGFDLGLELGPALGVGLLPSALRAASRASKSRVASCALASSSTRRRLNATSRSASSRSTRSRISVAWSSARARICSTLGPRCRYAAGSDGTPRPCRASEHLVLELRHVLVQQGDLAVHLLALGHQAGDIGLDLGDVAVNLAFFVATEALLEHRLGGRSEWEPVGSGRHGSILTRDISPPQARPCPPRQVAVLCSHEPERAGNGPSAGR